MIDIFYNCHGVNQIEVDLWRISGPACHSKQGQPRSGCAGPSLLLLSVCPRMRFHSLSMQLCPVFDYPNWETLV